MASIYTTQESFPRHIKAGECWIDFSEVWVHFHMTGKMFRTAEGIFHYRESFTNKAIIRMFEKVLEWFENVSLSNGNYFSWWCFMRGKEFTRKENVSHERKEWEILYKSEKCFTWAKWVRNSLQQWKMFHTILEGTRLGKSDLFNGEDLMWL